VKSVRFDIQSAPSRFLQHPRLGADLAREQVILADQQVVLVVVEGDRHAVIAEHLEGQRAADDLPVGHEVAHQRLEERLVGDPGGAEKAHTSGRVADEIEHRLHRPAAQAPPLAADHHLDIGGHLALDPQPPLGVHHPVEQAFLRAFVEDMAIDQPFALQARLDPVGGEEIEAFDVIGVGVVEKGMGVGGRFHRRAIAREHVEMRGARKRLQRGLQPVERGAHEAPLPPAAFHALLARRSRRAGPSARPDPGEGLRRARGRRNGSPRNRPFPSGARPAG
jgi:hypothetical protein